MISDRIGYFFGYFLGSSRIPPLLLDCFCYGIGPPPADAMLRTLLLVASAASAAAFAPSFGTSAVSSRSNAVTGKSLARDSLWRRSWACKFGVEMGCSGNCWCDARDAGQG
eukprot:756709-Hanusia_phi.AAC.9